MLPEEEMQRLERGTPRSGLEFIWVCAGVIFIILLVVKLWVL